jgi:hypothetical protein
MARVAELLGVGTLEAVSNRGGVGPYPSGWRGRGTGCGRHRPSGDDPDQPSLTDAMISDRINLQFIP